MKFSLNEIKQAFDLLIEEKKSREEIANWALKLLFAADERDLEYDPSDQEDKIWKGIKYLTGVDLLDMDGSYLHSIDNFIQYKEKIHL